MVLISPGQRLLHHLTASIFLQTPTNFPAALLDSQQASGSTNLSAILHQTAATLTDSPGQTLHDFPVTLYCFHTFSSTRSAVRKWRSFRTFLHSHVRTAADVSTSARAVVVGGGFVKKKKLSWTGVVCQLT